MAQITFTIADEHFDRVIDKLAIAFGYTEAQGPKAAFVKQSIIRMMKKQIRKVENNEAVEAATTTSIDPDIT